VQRGIGAGHRLLERVKVHYDEVYRVNAVLADGGAVSVVVANEQQASVNLRVQRFYAAIEHFGEARVGAEFFHIQPRFGKGFCRAAGGDEFDAGSCEVFGERDEAGFIGYREQGA